MKSLTLQDITLKKIWQMLLVVLIPFISVTGVSAVPYNLRFPLIYAVGIGFVVVFLLTDIRLEFNMLTVSALLILAYLGISMLYSYDPSATIRLFLLYACSFTLFFIDLPQSYYTKIITIIYVICSVIAFSILISSVIENCMLRYFSFIVNPLHTSEVTRLINKELAIGSYSGFAREKAEAAYIMNVGIAVVLSRYFSDGKLAKKDIFMLIVFLAALMLTGKRMLFLVAIVALAVFMLISNVKSKTFKTLCIIIIALCALFVVIMFVPKIANIFDRFLDQDNVETIGNRDFLWKYMLMMASEYPAFGAGFGSYNQYSYDHGLEIGGDKWSYNGHNCYLQVFAELGVAGSIIFAIFVILAFVYTVKAIKKFRSERDSVYMCYFSLYIQILIIVYSVTGNPVYSRQIVFIWFFSIGMVLYLNRKNKNTEQLPNKYKLRRRSI